MAPKAKKEAMALPKDEAKAKAMQAKKAVLKCIHSHKKKIRTSPTFWQPKSLWFWESQNILKIVSPGETSLTTMLSSNCNDHEVSHEENKG